MRQSQLRARRSVGSCMPMAGVLSRDGTRPHLLGDVRKKGDLCEHGMMHVMACVFLFMNVLHYRLAS